MFAPQRNGTSKTVENCQTGIYFLLNFYNSANFLIRIIIETKCVVNSEEKDRLKGEIAKSEMQKNEKQFNNMASFFNSSNYANFLHFSAHLLRLINEGK